MFKIRYKKGKDVIRHYNNDFLSDESEVSTRYFKLNYYFSSLSPNSKIFTSYNLHREDGPAIEWATGATEWLRYGSKHRLNGPAVERPDGYKEWWCNGVKHNGNGLVETISYSVWYKDGLIHKEDGPAITYKDGKEEWWINGIKLSGNEDFKKSIK